jgi:hypothetical protein
LRFPADAPVGSCEADTRLAGILDAIRNGRSGSPWTPIVADQHATQNGRALSNAPAPWIGHRL